MKKVKKQLIRLFETRDVRRRRKLYECYEHCFEQRHSANFTIELINTDLGRQLVGRPDIKYIRSHIEKWKAENSQAHFAGSKTESLDQS